MTLTALGSSSAAPAPQNGTPVGFLETFALAEDRRATLQQLVPGTDDHYYYSCLVLQAEGRLDDVDGMLERWQREGRSGGAFKQIEARQALLRVSTDPDTTYRYLERELGLRFDDRRRVPGESPDLPTVLDGELIDTERLLRAILERGRKRDLDGVDPILLESLVRRSLTKEQTADLLGRLDRADIPGLVQVIVRDLEAHRGLGFGARAVHARLTLDQLEELRGARPEMLSDAQYVQGVLQRLAPRSDESMDDSEDERAYLSRAWDFVRTLPTAFNSMKANVLYHRLVHGLDRGEVERTVLTQYLRLPRRVYYFPQRSDNRLPFVDLNATLPGGPLRPIGNEEPIVVEAMQQSFRGGATVGDFRGLVEESFLNRVWAETQLVYGQAENPEAFIDMIGGAAAVEVLKNRVEIQFARTNREVYGPNDEVQLDVDIKNVDTLLVKVFEVDPVAYFDRYGSRVSSAIDLDGLVANFEETLRYDAPPLWRVRRTYALDRIEGPGTYVVELIGGGVSSRAVVRKGSLHLVGRTGPAGHVLQVLDDARQPAASAVVRFGGRDFVADERGHVAVPYTTSPGTKSVLLRSGGVASVALLEHLGDSYELEAGIHVPRESLLAGMRAPFLVRPRLTVHGNVVPLEILERPVLELRATTLDGTESTQTFDDLVLTNAGDLRTEIQVPERAVQFRAVLRGTVRSLTTGEEVALAGQWLSFDVNRVGELQTRQPVLTRTPEGYAVDVIGRNGESWPGTEVRLTLKHRGFTSEIGRSLMTDERGRARLGWLPEIERLEVQVRGQGSVRYDLDAPGAYGLPGSLRTLAGAEVRVPYTGAASVMSRSVGSLVRVVDGLPLSDHFDALSIEDGYVVARGLGAGEYQLRLPVMGVAHRLQVVDGTVVHGHVVDEHRALAATTPIPLQIRAVRSGEEGLVVQLGGASPLTRVHVFASRTVDTFDSTRGLAFRTLEAGGSSTLVPERTSFESGREISDEYRYILDRRRIDPYPGNMLLRPGYLLNPWVVGETRDEMADAGRMGGAYEGVASSAPARMGGRGRAQGGGGPQGESSPHTLDFLASGAAVLDGLRPDEAGRVVVSLDALGEGHVIRVVAVDERMTVAKDITRPERPWKLRDRRLVDPLDAARPMTQQRRIAFLKAGESLVIRDAPNAGAQSFETLADVFRLYRTTGGGDELGRFEFLTRWPGLDEEEKLAKYSEYACHELHAFLREKDPAFFDAVVRPYLANKGHRTFMDDWALGNDLAGYLEPHRFERLNVVEAILLLKSREGDAARHAADLLALVPRGTFALDAAFGTVLASGSLGVERQVLAQTLDAVRKVESAAASTRMAKRSRVWTGGGGGGPATPGPAGPSTPGPAAPGDSEVAFDAPSSGGRDNFFLGRGAMAERVDVELSEVATDDRLESLGYSDGDPEAIFELRRQAVGYFYRDLDETQEYAETHYWKVRLGDTQSGVVTASPFWLDFARSQDGFVSSSFPFANRNVNEMLLALAFLDLPFEAAEHEIKADGRSVSMTARSPMYLALEDIADAAPAADAPKILVGQDIFRVDRRTAEVDGVMVEQFVQGEFLTGVPYGCRMVVTNPSSGPVEMQALVQIPEGAVALGQTNVTKGLPLTIGAYGTQSIETLFYFPSAGDFSDYPIHVGRGSALLGAADARTLSVVLTPTTVDTETWEWISQNADLAALLEYLRASNPRTLDLGDLAWRMSDKQAFDGVMAILGGRNIAAPVLERYAIRHRDLAATRGFLLTNDAMIQRVGAPFESPVLDVLPRERALYEHLAYEPLVNGRTHEFGGERRILNAEFSSQYDRFLTTLAVAVERSADESMELSYYLLLQDRIGEALAVFASIERADVTAKLQHDYMTAYMAFYRGELAAAKDAAARHAEHPVARWRARFGDVLAQIEEIEGRTAERDVDPESTQGVLAGAEPVLTLDVADGQVRVTHEGLERLEVRYHRMDVEFLFSTSPFVRGGEGSFGLIQPNRVDVFALDAGATATTFDIPADLQSANVVVEVRSGGLARRTTYFAGDLAVQGRERYGEVRVVSGEQAAPLARAYVKVYARLADGSIRFHKDGYTDLRGRFDYVSLSGVSGSAPERFALLVMHDQAGATITELAPPAR